MIALLIPATSEGGERFVTRLNRFQSAHPDGADSFLVSEGQGTQLYSGANGLFELSIVDQADFDADVVLIDPKRSTCERLIRADSAHNTFLVTERCDQLCVMCSQPPKATHVDRFAEFAQAARLAPQSATIGISGGEPTLYKSDLLHLLETSLDARPDLDFHILSNGQHFEASDIERLRSQSLDRVTWGIPLYSHIPEIHDEIVGKVGAYARLLESMTHLLRAGEHIELRTVLLAQNIEHLAEMAQFIATHFGFCDQWSLMQLENIGFARNRFASLYVDHRQHIGQLTRAIDRAELYGLQARLFNVARCTVPAPYRRYALASISDWKRKYATDCDLCRERSLCSGFFEWHPDTLLGVSVL